MNSNEKRWIVLLVAVIIIAIVLIVALNVGNRENNLTNNEQGQIQSNGSQNEEQNNTTIELEDGTTVNTSEKLNSAKTYGSLEISNISFEEKDGITYLVADVTNKGEAVHEPEIVELTLLGENGEEIKTIRPVIGRVAPGETIRLDASTTTDVVSAQDFRIEAAQ